MSKGTRPTQVRLSDADKERVERCRVRYGLSTASDVIRYALAVIDEAKPIKIRESRKIPE
jgi:Arc/MetJ-type ribon-helix-helix transcriptional regulator